MANLTPTGSLKEIGSDPLYYLCTWASTLGCHREVSRTQSPNPLYTKVLYFKHGDYFSKTGCIDLEGTSSTYFTCGEVTVTSQLSIGHSAATELPDMYA